MRCELCGAHTRAVETRGTRRRRECTNGHRFSTLEVVAIRVSKTRAERVELARKVLRAKGLLK